MEVKTIYISQPQKPSRYSRQNNRYRNNYNNTDDVFVKNFDKEFDKEIKREQIRQEQYNKAKKQRLTAILTALGIISATAGVTVGFPAKATTKNTTIPNQIEQEANDIIQLETLPYEISNEDYSYTDNSKVIEENSVEQTAEQAEITKKPSTDEMAQEILNSNSEVKYNYNKIKESLDRFSEQLGEDCLPLIKRRVEELGNNRVSVLDVLKILEIETKGRIYDPDNPKEIIASFTNEAYGPFQLTPDTVDYVNYYYKLEGTDKELDVMDPYDNLDACILYLRFLRYQKETQLNEGKTLPTGNDVNLAVMWGYHDGAWENDISDYGRDYLQQYTELSSIDDYPEVVAYLLNEEVPENV